MVVSSTANGWSTGVLMTGKASIGLPARQIATSHAGRRATLSSFSSLCIVCASRGDRSCRRLTQPCLLSATLIAVGLSALCAAGHADAQTNSRVNIAVTETSDTYNPYGDSNSLMYGVWCHVYGCLIEYDFDKADYTGLLAQSWEVADPKTWVFHLRRDIRWQNGEPLRAADVVHSFTRVMTDPQSKQKQNLSMVERM